MSLILPRLRLAAEHLRSREAESFAVFRILFGTYLLVHFGGLIPHGSDLFSSAGMLPSATLNPRFGEFPSLLNISDTPAAVSGLLGALVFLSAMFGLGIFRRACAVLLWVGHASLLHRNVLIMNVSYDYVGWMLLACAVIPEGEPLRVFGRPTGGWRVPTLIYVGGWLIFAFGYSLNGWLKFNSWVWKEGSALDWILSADRLVSDGFLPRWLAAAPSWVRRWGTWAPVCGELSAVPLAVFSVSRVFSWSFLTAMHMVSLFLFRIQDLTIGMLLFQLFILPGLWRVPAIGPSMFGGRESASERPQDP